MGYRKLLFCTTILAACAAAQAQAPDYKVGKTLNEEEIRAFDPWNPVSNDGKGLPAGSGKSDEGAKIYAQKCAFCHGTNGWEGQAPALVANKSANSPHPPFPIQPPFATVLWDYIYRAMPMQAVAAMPAAGTLKPNEVYSLTAFLLFKNGLIKEDDVLDAQTLPKVKMPKRDLYVQPAVVKTWPLPAPSNPVKAKN